MFANEVFKTEVEALGIRFVEMGDAANYNELANDPAVWDTRRGIEMLFKATVEHMDEAIELLEAELAGADVVVASSLGWAGRMVRDIHDVPLVMAHLAPALFRSTTRLPRTEVMWVRDSYPEFLKKLWWRAGDFLVDRLVVSDLNRIRARYGLEPVHRVLRDWAVYSPDVTLGLFPEWFGPPQPDWLRPVALTGFPLYGGGDPPGEGLAEWVDAEEPPVVFTSGSANRHAAPYFATAADIADGLGLRCLLVTSARSDVPDRLSANTRHADYVPFSWLLPRSRALISNGGVGTCAQAFAAGIPHLVVHANFDQRDNGSRVDDLGAGTLISARDFEGDVAMQAVQSVLTPEVAERSAALAGRVDARAARVAACEAIEAAAG